MTRVVAPPLMASQALQKVEHNSTKTNRNPFQMMLQQLSEEQTAVNLSPESSDADQILEQLNQLQDLSAEGELPEELVNHLVHNLISFLQDLGKNQMLQTALQANSSQLSKLQQHFASSEVQSLQKMVAPFLGLYEHVVKQEKGSPLHKKMDNILQSIVKNLTQSGVLSEPTSNQGQSKQLIEIMENIKAKLADQRTTFSNDTLRTWVQTKVSTTNQVNGKEIAFHGQEGMLGSKINLDVLPQKGETVKQQSFILEQIQKALESSQFNRSQNQLTIKLKPNHLGDVTLKFTQINNETVVKILVASSSAKELLEGSLTQLKNMFSPHQVVVEKQQDPLLHQSSSLAAQDHQDEQDDQEAREDHETTNDDRTEEEEGSSFKDVLFQIKV
ncbi:flagellar hook-length control protein FliK [Salirhabdus salicampi]|uniref:flagellar hook-length control protein FliK n=1 Tax=Salirhabdus salicampi TaxID=476102 RepID=UPI0020C48C96|nr:flagellar hook-length control protein FliK [Salirhabdus salicampi]MCP8616519.1 flagellar hook-length control protein FliK [Salirhabdus salicampi]